jgi:anaerobic ribonucleoside-triphosphate reductase
VAYRKPENKMKGLLIPCEVFQRVVGYFRPVQQWNPGKQEEFKNRQEYKIPKV